jgi:hypothetical protein
VSIDAALTVASHLRGERIVGHDDGAGEVGELAAHLGHDEVADDEADGGVAGVDGPGAGSECAEGGRTCDQIRHWLLP